MYKKIFIAFSLISSFNAFVFSQMNTKDILGQLNPISTAVPFLTIATDSRAGAMGDAGVATSPDANSMHWNPSKYAFIENEAGIALSYTPWLRQLVSDMDLLNLAFYKRIDKQQVVAASLLYFSLGDIEFMNEAGQYVKTARPNEFAFDLAYARSFGKKFSGGLAFRFIRSDLSNGGNGTTDEAKAGTAFAADISTYYKDKLKLSGYDGNYALGINISNMGNKMSYSAGDLYKDFIPINLRIGGAVTINADKFNSFTVTADLNKLLVPTPYIKEWVPSANGSDSIEIKHGKDPDVPVITGMFQSFSDAPGGFKEELNEITYSFGVEYWYRKQFALRAGYFNENLNKGNRKYFTAGIGLKFNVLGFDFSYLIPQAANNPLANTLRFTLTFDFNAFRKLNRR